MYTAVDGGAQHLQPPRRGKDRMAIALQPSYLLAAHLQMEQQEGVIVFQLTEAAQGRLEDLLIRRKEVRLSAEEQADLDALGELDRIFTYINAQLALAAGHTPAR